jgi:hypothetical protein
MPRLKHGESVVSVLVLVRAEITLGVQKGKGLFLLLLESKDVGKLIDDIVITLSVPLLELFLLESKE